MTPDYYRLEKVPYEILKNHGARKPRNDRLDCTQAFMNDVNRLEGHCTKKGLMNFSIRSTDHVVTADQRRKADICLISNGGNLSSLYSLGNDEVFFGNCRYKRDGYIFITEKNLSNVDLFVFPEECFLVKQHYVNVLNGKYDDLFNDLRGKAEQFYNYST